MRIHELLKYEWYIRKKGMATLTVEETRAFVEKLIATGNGDSGRLMHILNTINLGRKLYNSDQKYLDSKLANEIGLVQKIKTEEGLVAKVQRLITARAGDIGRLQFILESLQQGKSLYKSDRSYLEAKLGERINPESVLAQKEPEQTIDSLKSQVTLANQRIARLEHVLQDKSNQLETIQTASMAKVHQKPAAGAMPKGWSPPKQDLDQIRQQISAEQCNLEREKNKTDQLKIEQSKLMQIILDRKEFEKQLRIEQERLQQQIELERKAVKEQAALVEQIKLQEEELEKAKRERDAIVAKLHAEQTALSSQVAAERAKLAEQTRAAQKIQQEHEHLQAIKEEYEKVMQTAKSKEMELEAQVKMERSKLEQQEKILKQISNYEKYLESSRQKQALLAAKIAEQKDKLKKTSTSISQIEEDQHLLDAILAEKIALEQQIKLADSELKSIRKDKTLLERQLRTQKSTLSKIKKQETGKVKTLKQKKQVLAKQIRTEATQIKKIAKKLEKTPNPSSQ
ncbi:conserved hypothetical protein [Candidatus Nitrosotenuis uzonensis]|uniref:Uncharacterized protein n=2 Tax=Candidatus Nitrosotenuis uzonensis TaxID=1407055 RepID=A0A812F105_9ARCH|nr:conserved hypothetical protein [Candidatus Nitrosotenuis uzonensis]